MAFPNGVQVATLTFSRPTTFLGVRAEITEVTMEPTTSVVWRATGDPIEDVVEKVVLGEGEDEGVIAVPVVDQEGFTDLLGNDITGWGYKLTRVAQFGAERRTLEKYWAPVMGQEVVDFDNLPGGEAGPFEAVSPVPVTSVAGHTGAVSVDDLQGSLDPWLEGKLGGLPTIDSVLPAVEEAVRTEDSPVRDAVEGVARTTASEATAGFLNADEASVLYETKINAGMTYQTKEDAAAALETKADAAAVEGLAQGIGQLIPTNGARPVGQGELGASVKDYGAVGDGVADDAAAIARAHTANGAVYYPPGNYTPGAANNLYNTGYSNAIGPRWQAGTPGVPTPDARPVVWAQKHSSASRGTNPAEWDQGAGYFSLVKQVGDAYGAGLTGYARHTSADGGQVIGVHGRAQAAGSAAQVWGSWSYAFSPAGVVPHTVIGHEINIVNKGEDQGWRASGGVGQHRGLVVVTADGSNPVTQGVFIGANSAAPNGFMHTGLKIEGSGVMASDAAVSATGVANNELLQLEGAASGGQSTGVRFRGGRFRTGISLAEASYDSNAAILLGDQQRIVVGAGPGSSRYLGFDLTTGLANFSNLSIAVNGVRVVGPQRPGWGVNAGADTRTGFDTATVTVPQLAERVKALLADLKAHGLIGA